ncbi:hypothetical protein VQ045_12515 [Aurantimonas sp. E1-2-R+4]|uniref:glycoside hydrolase family 24 protein n=1 Tax=Aurantimonas sp. E1-2-R+4 TaxID=3113714 RepID=UPI002F93F7AA
MPIRDASFYEGLLDDPNVQGVLAAIMEAEGTAKRDDPYSVGFGFTTLPDLNAHPGQSLSRSFTANGRRNRSGAAGAFQFVERTWNEIAGKLGLTDFSPRSQQVATLAKIDERGALRDVLEGDVEGFVSKTKNEWASLPGSPHGQRTVSMKTIKDAWAGAREVAARRGPSPADARLADAWGYQDPNTTRGLTTPANTPMPGGLLDDPRGMRDLSAGLLGGVAPPSARPAGMGLAMPTPTARASNMGRPGVPTPMSRPSPAMAPPSVMSAAVQERMTGVPLSDRQITASIPDMPRESAMLSRTAPSINARPAMERPSAMASLSPAVQERMGGFPAAPAPTQRAATGDLSPSVMDRMGGLFSMDAKAATIPGAARLSPDDRIAQATQHGAQGSWAPTGATGSWAPAPTVRPNFAGPMGSPRAAGVPDYQAPTASPYSPPPSSYQTPAFSTATPQIDALGHPPIPGLQRAPQAPAQPQYQAQATQPASYPAPRDVAPAPHIAGPVGQVQQDQQLRGNIPAGSYISDNQRMADMVAASQPQPKAPGLFSGGFNGPTGIMGGAMLGGAVGGLPGALVGGLLGSQTVRNGIGLGDMGRETFQNDWSPAINPGGGVVVGSDGRPTYSLANGGTTTPGGMSYDPWSGMRGTIGVSQPQQRQAANRGLFDGWGSSGNEASSSAINGRTTSYADGRTERDGKSGSKSGGLW